MAKQPWFKKAIHLALAVALALPAPLAAQNRPAEVVQDRFLNALINAKLDRQLPPKLDVREADLFHLLSQELDAGSGAKLNLATTVIELPHKALETAADALDYRLENGDLVLTDTRDGHRHTIKNLSGVKIIESGFDVFVVSSDGKIRVLSKELITRLAFTSPIPVFEIAQVERAEGLEVELVNSRTRVTGIADQVRADLARDEQKPALFDGDLIVKDRAGILQTVFDAEYMTRKIQIESVVLALLNATQNPEFFRDENWIRKLLQEHGADLGEIQSVLDRPDVKEAMKAHEYRNSLARLPKAAIRAGQNKIAEVRGALLHGPVRTQRLLEDVTITLSEYEARLEKAEQTETAADAQLSRADEASKRIDRRMVKAVKDFGAKLD
ncbi:MAG: hypothetical protein ABL958_17355, partial [Bdellovibrionia bacterium]